MNNEQTKATIEERFGNRHNPVLRWRVGDYESLHIASGLTPLSDGEADVCKFEGVSDFCDCAGECSPETELTDSEWADVLRYMAREA